MHTASQTAEGLCWQYCMHAVGVGVHYGVARRCFVHNSRLFEALLPLWTIFLQHGPFPLVGSIKILSLMLQSLLLEWDRSTAGCYLMWCILQLRCISMSSMTMLLLLLSMMLRTTLSRLSRASGQVRCS